MGSGGDFDADGLNKGKQSIYSLNDFKVCFHFFFYLSLYVREFAEDEDGSDTEEEEIVGKKEVAPPISNEVEASA